MTGTEIIQLITILVAVASVVISALTNRAAARKADLSGLQDTVCTLQAENKRLSEKVLRLEAINEERALRISALEITLREATQGRVERTQYIRVLESDNDALRAKVKALEKEIP